MKYPKCMNPRPLLLVALYGIMLLLFPSKFLTFGGYPRYFFDYYDFRVFFETSDWVVSERDLYLDIPSAYPLLPNLLFGLIRIIAEKLAGWGLFWGEAMLGFRWLWLVSAFYLFVLSTRIVMQETGKIKLLLWLTPGTLYFILQRYDIYPALFLMTALRLVARHRPFLASLSLGFSIALKGYALFTMPAFLYFIYTRHGWGKTFFIFFISLLPWLISHAAAFLWVGWEGVIAPYKFHAGRGLNDESSYDAFRYLTAFATGREIPGKILQETLRLDYIAPVLQVSLALFPLFYRPKNFEMLIHAFLISILGFVSFSQFHSPQYALWIVSVAVFSSRRLILITAFLMGWFSYLYFPVLSDMRNTHETLFRIVIISITAFQFTMLYSAARGIGTRRT